MQTVYLVRTHDTGTIDLISLATSWLSLGVSAGKVILLKDYLPYRKRRAAKIEALQEQVRAQGESGNRTSIEMRTILDSERE